MRSVGRVRFLLRSARQGPCPNPHSRANTHTHTYFNTPFTLFPSPSPSPALALADARADYWAGEGRRRAKNHSQRRQCQGCLPPPARYPAATCLPPPRPLPCSHFWLLTTPASAVCAALRSKRMKRQQEHAEDGGVAKERAAHAARVVSALTTN
jgi:hypothetical protein